MTATHFGVHGTQSRPRQCESEFGVDPADFGLPIRPQLVEMDVRNRSVESSQRLFNAIVAQVELAARRKRRPLHDQRGEILALQVLLHQIRPDRVEPEVEGADDRWMVEVAGDLGFAQELRAQLRIFGRADLDRDEPRS